jgi:hypothetical protein
MLGMGKDPTKAAKAPTAACAKIKKARLSGQVRKFTGNDYAADLAAGNIAIAIAWSGDIQGLAADNPDLKWIAPSEGAMLYSDNMIIPKVSDRQDAAMAWINYVYDPKHSAQIVAGAPTCPRPRAPARSWPRSRRIWPRLLVNLRRTTFGRGCVFRALSDAEDTGFNRIFQDAIGAWNHGRHCFRGIEARPLPAGRRRACCGSWCSSSCPRSRWPRPRSPGRRAGGRRITGTEPTAPAFRSFRYAFAATLWRSRSDIHSAYFIAFRADQEFKNLLLGLVVLPFFTTFLVRTFAWKTILNDGGPAVWLLQSLHILGEGAAVTSSTPPSRWWAALRVQFPAVHDPADLREPRRRSTGGWWRRPRISTRRRSARSAGGAAALSLPGVFAGGLLTFISRHGRFHQRPAPRCSPTSR